MTSSIRFALSAMLILCVAAPILQVSPASASSTGAADQKGPIAESHPPLTPTRDAEVIYAVQPEKFPQSLDVAVMFKAGGNFLRVDGPKRAATTIFDRKNHFVTLILHQQKLFNRFSPKVGLRNPFMLDLAMEFTRLDQISVAGVTCTRWAINSRYGSATACVTDDGLILSEEGVDADGVRGTLLAKSVRYIDMPASVFAVPKGYQSLPVNGLSKSR